MKWLFIYKRINRPNAWNTANGNSGRAEHIKAEKLWKSNYVRNNYILKWIHNEFQFEHFLCLICKNWMDVGGSALDIWKSFPLIVKVNFKYLNKQQYRQKQEKNIRVYTAW